MPVFSSFFFFHNSVIGIINSTVVSFDLYRSFLQAKEKELMEFNKTVNEARSKMDVAQSELDIYLSRHNTAVSHLNKAKETLTSVCETLKERKAAIKDISAKLPKAEQELKEVSPNFLIGHFFEL